MLLLAIGCYWYRGKERTCWVTVAQALPRAGFSLDQYWWFGVGTYLWTRPPTLNPGLDCTRLEKGRKTKNNVSIFRPSYIIKYISSIHITAEVSHLHEVSTAAPHGTPFICSCKTVAHIAKTDACTMKRTAVGRPAHYCAAQCGSAGRASRRAE